VHVRTLFKSIDNMKTIETPIVKVVKFQAKDVITTSNVVPQGPETADGDGVKTITSGASRAW